MATMTSIIRDHNALLLTNFYVLQVVRVLSFVSFSLVLSIVPYQTIAIELVNVLLCSIQNLLPDCLTHCLIRNLSLSMGNEELEDTLAYPRNVFKVHHSMCTALKRLVDRISAIFPDIEAAKPGCSSGIQTLCLLNNTIDKSNQILEYCLDSSKLYLAITGEMTLLRFQNLKNILENSLGQLRTNVPLVLSTEISNIIDDLKATNLSLNPSDKEAGKVLLGLVHNSSSASDSSQISEKESIQFAATRLQITSEKAIILESRAIKKLLGKVNEDEGSKRKVLTFFLYLLKKHRSLITDSRKNENSHDEVDYSDEAIRYAKRLEADCYDTVGTCLGLTKDFDRGPEKTLTSKLTCPITGKLMYDPVVISSGETFERMWIQKWFDEGNTNCPKTSKRLIDFTLTPNNVVKTLISEWCLEHGVRLEHPNKLQVDPLDVSSSSIACLRSAINEMQLPLDASIVSFESSDYSSDSRTRIIEASGLASVVEAEGQDMIQTRLHGADLDLIFRLSELSWDHKCKVVDDVKYQLQCNNPRSKRIVRPEKLVGPLIAFLRHARDNNESTAMKSGSELLLMVVKKVRSEMLNMDDDALNLLASLLDTEAIGESLAILDVLSADSSYCLKLAASGVILSLVKLIESSNRRYQEMAIKGLINLSTEKEVCSQIVAFGCIQKLILFLDNAKLARFCILLMKNLCASEEGRVSVAETDGCITAISELLDGGTHEEQEHAVDLLLFLCTIRVEYCRLIMNETIILPSLVYITNNGSEKAKGSALELLRQLRDVNFEEKSEARKSDKETITQVDIVIVEERKPSSKKRGYLKKNFKFFHKFI